MMRKLVLIGLALMGLTVSFHLSMTLPFSNKQKLQKLLVKGLQSASILATAAATVIPLSSNAKVYFDTDTYGDKELKIATVNKIKQKLRNAILADNSLAPELLQLSINDALGYNADNQAGGPDGSIRYEIKADGPNAGLQKGLDALLSIKKEVQRTTQISFGDLAAFGGAEALESAGCPRMTVQVGRTDAKDANQINTVINWSAPTAATVLPAFRASGFDERDITVLLGALGELKRIVTETKTAKDKKKQEEEEDDEDAEDEPFVPTSFGARDATYGAKIGLANFGNKYFASILSGNKDELAEVLLSDPKIKSIVQKYGGKGGDATFKTDVPDVYLKMTNLGSEVCSQKFCSS